MRKNILIKIHQPRFKKSIKKKKDVVLIPAAAFEAVSLYSHDNEAMRATSSFFKNLLT